MKTFEELLAEAADIIERGDKDKIATLFKENYQYREKMRSQKEAYEGQIKELREKVPGDNAVSVPKEEYETLTSFKEQVGDFEQIQTRLQAIERLEQENGTLKNKWNLTRAAQQFGYNTDALEPLVQGKNIVFEEDTPFILDGDSKKKLDEYVENDLSVFIPAIKTGQGSKYPRQGVGEDNDGASAGTIVDNFIERQKSKMNKEKN
jgi:uncharacterized protein (UPF0335 family)